MCLFKFGVFWAGKMAQRIKENVRKPGDLNLISRMHMAEGEPVPTNCPFIFP